MDNHKDKSFLETEAAYLYSFGDTPFTRLS